MQLASFQHGVSQKSIKVRRASTGELLVDRKLVSFSANQEDRLLAAADIAVDAHLLWTEASAMIGFLQPEYKRFHPK
jgi:hypothetical protein